MKDKSFRLAQRLEAKAAGDEAAAREPHRRQQMTRDNEPSASIPTDVVMRFDEDAHSIEITVRSDGKLVSAYMTRIDTQRRLAGEQEALLVRVPRALLNDDGAYFCFRQLLGAFAQAVIRNLAVVTRHDQA